MEFAFTDAYARDGPGKLLEVVPGNEFCLLAIGSEVGEAGRLPRAGERTAYEVVDACDGLSSSAVNNEARPPLSPFVKGLKGPTGEVRDGDMH